MKRVGNTSYIGADGCKYLIPRELREPLQPLSYQGEIDNWEAYNSLLDGCKHLHNKPVRVST